MASPIDDLVDHLKTSLHAQRRDGAARVERIRNAADAYLAALEQQIVREFSSNHGFGAVAPGLSAREAAERLLAAVRELPELKSEPKLLKATHPAAATPAKDLAPTKQPSDAAARLTPKRNSGTAEAPTSGAAGIVAPARRQALDALTLQRPLVVVGRLGKKDRLDALASELPPEVEWLDTNQHGMAAIGNLDRRIRERRVGALVLVEGSLSHKHTEPLVSAARQHGVAFAYANKGGKQSILRALDDLERQLSSG